MMQPIRTTLIFGFMSCLVSVPLSVISLRHGGTEGEFRFFLWTNLAIFSLLLSRWSNTPLKSILYPLLLAGVFIFWPNAQASPGIIVVFLAVLSWIRSGICFNASPLRGFVAELATIGGGAGLLVLGHSGSPAALALALWLFFLVQSLYFFIVPIAQEDSMADANVAAPDRFERACRDMERLL